MCADVINKNKKYYIVNSNISIMCRLKAVFLISQHGKVHFTLTLKIATLLCTSAWS